MRSLTTFHDHFRLHTGSRRESSRTRSCFTRPTSGRACSSTSSRSSTRTSRAPALANSVSSSPSSLSQTSAMVWSFPVTARLSSLHGIALSCSSRSRAKSSTASSTMSPGCAPSPFPHPDVLTPNCRFWAFSRRSALLNCFVLAAGARDASLVITYSTPPSPQLLHPDFKFDPSSNPPSYASQDQVSFSDPLLQRRIW